MTPEPIVYAASPYTTSPYAPVRPTNTLAIVAFILAFFVSVAAIVCGHIALSQIKRTGEAGHGFALAAVIIGYVSVGLALIFIVIYAIIAIVVLMGAGVAAAGNAL